VDAGSSAEVVAARPLVALIGNPNTGKTTLFNGLTGSRARVGNYPGVTVERRSATMRLPGGEAPARDGARQMRDVELVDLPGCYSLAARSADEQIAIGAILGFGEHPRPDLVVAVVDAGQLVRNLYLVLQLCELEVPVVVALNMVDELAKPPDTALVERLFGLPCVAISARNRQGLDELRTAVGRALDERPVGGAAVAYPAALLADAERVAAALPAAWRGSPTRERALALWALSSLDIDDELRDVHPDLRAATLSVLRGGRDVDAEIITARYAFLDASLGAPPSSRAADAGTQRAAPAAERAPRVERLTDRIDRVVLHPVWGFVVFVLLMLMVFQALFSWAEPLIGVVETLFGWLGQQARAYLPSGFVADLVAEGIIAGVGNVVVFLPQIVLLFLLLGLLEDSGYMARAAYLMDRVMRALGLHGRAFVPMLSGCACAIPAIMATRTMERERDRLLTMLVVPLMTCSARLPVYTLVIAALFPPSRLFGAVPVQGLLMVAMYVFATLVALAAAGVLGRTVVKGRRMPLLLELPPYRLPTVRTVARQSVERAGVFLKEAGTVILACTIVLWALLSYPKPETPRPLETKAVAGLHQIAAGNDVDVRRLADGSEDLSAWQAARLQNSYGGRIGHAVEPVTRPLGFDWKLDVGLLGAFAAREVFVSTMGLVYGIGQGADEESTPLREHLRTDARADGRPAYTPLVGLSLMIFFALACQCTSTLAIVRRETKTWRWPAFLLAYTTGLAWLVSFLVYQGGKLLGFG
jgi:ferrous iron transport protein B